MPSKQKEETQFDLRICTIKDIQSVININEQTLPENYPLFFYKQILERYPESFYLAYLKNDPEQIIGYVMWRTERGPSAFQLNQVKKGHLVSLAVLQDYRRMGVASALLDKSMAVVNNSCVEEYVLEVRVSNGAALRLYKEQSNFEIIKIISNYYRDGEDAYYMCKNNNLENYIHGSRNMSEDAIISFYREKKKEYFCYRCPNCKSLLIKSVNYSLMGGVNPNDKRIVKCPYCSQKISAYTISLGKYDV